MTELTNETQAHKDFMVLIGQTEAMEQMLRFVQAEPARILRRICREYEKYGTAVPDHHVHLSGYIGEASMKALISAGLMQSRDGGKISLWEYEPTEAGLAQYTALRDSGFYETTG